MTDLTNTSSVLTALEDNTQKDPVPTFDGHVDLLYHMMRFAPGIPFEDLADGILTPDHFKAGNLRLMVSAFYCADIHNGPQTSVNHLNDLYQYALKMLTGLKPVLRREDLKDAYQGREAPGVLYLLENGDALVNDDPVKWKERGIFAVGLTHAGRNRIGCGNGVKNPSGLTGEGRRLVRNMARLGMAVDLAHLSEPCFWETASVFSGTVMSSHTGLRRFCDLPRNLSHEQVRFIMDQGGVIGVTVNPEMLAMDQNAGLDEVFNHIDWLVQHYGDRQVALGSDFGGFDMPAQNLAHPGQLPALTDLMARDGYPLEAIQNIMGRNWYRFYASVLP